MDHHEAQGRPLGAKLLDDWMKAKGLSVAKVAELLEVDRTSIWAWRKGRNPPDAKSRKSIAGITGAYESPQPAHCIPEEAWETDEERAARMKRLPADAVSNPPRAA